MSFLLSHTQTQAHAYRFVFASVHILVKVMTLIRENVSKFRISISPDWYLINRLRKQLEKLYVDQWENERQNIIRKQRKSKLELYFNIKSIYRRETYIDDVRDVQTRKCKTQIRLSAH